MIVIYFILIFQTVLQVSTEKNERRQKQS